MKLSFTFNRQVEEDRKHSHVTQVLEIEPSWESSADLVLEQVPPTMMSDSPSDWKRIKNSHLFKVPHVGPFWKSSTDLILVQIPAPNHEFSLNSSRREMKVLTSFEEKSD